MAFKTTGVKVADFKAAQGNGVLQRVVVACADAAPTAGTITIYDNTNALGTILFQEVFTTTPFRAYAVEIGCDYHKGLYMDFTTTADVNVTLIYQ